MRIMNQANQKQLIFYKGDSPNNPKIKTNNIYVSIKGAHSPLINARSPTEDEGRILIFGKGLQNSHSLY